MDVCYLVGVPTDPATGMPCVEIESDISTLTAATRGPNGGGRGSARAEAVAGPQVDDRGDRGDGGDNDGRSGRGSGGDVAVDGGGGETTARPTTTTARATSPSSDCTSSTAATASTTKKRKKIYRFPFQDDAPPVLCSQVRMRSDDVPAQ